MAASAAAAAAHLTSERPRPPPPPRPRAGLRLAREAAQPEEVVDPRDDGDGHRGEDEQVEPQGRAVHRDEEEDGRDLHRRLGLPPRSRGDHDALLGGRHPRDRDGELPGDDDHRDPRRQAAELHERDQRGQDQELVGDGIHELAERRDLLARAREVPVDGVGDRGHREDHRGKQVPLRQLGQQHDDEHRHEQDPEDGEGVREVEREHAGAKALRDPRAAARRSPGGA
jgi:hypothetical protein